MATPPIIGRVPGIHRNCYRIVGTDRDGYDPANPPWMDIIVQPALIEHAPPGLFDRMIEIIRTPGIRTQQFVDESTMELVFQFRIQHPAQKGRRP